MKKSNSVVRHRKLVLRPEAIALLTPLQLGQALGAVPLAPNNSGLEPYCEPPNKQDI